MPKFDVCVMNPPYGALYLRVMDIAIEKAESTVVICPGQFAKTCRKAEKFDKFKQKHKCSKHVFKANPFAEAALLNDAGIFVFDGSKNKEDWDNIKYEKFFRPAVAKSICEKLAKNDSIEKYMFSETNASSMCGNYRANASPIRGHYHPMSKCWDWTTLFSDNARRDFSAKEKSLMTWSFSTEEECRNFIKSTETDILMFGLYATKDSMNMNRGECVLMPWLGDYTHEWTEEMIQKELGITDEELEYIHEEMKDFGWKVKEREKK